MIIAWLLVFVIGTAFGYFAAQRGSRRHWQTLLAEQEAQARAELDAAKQQIQALRQDNADLNYKLGESEKSRRYLETKNQRDASD